MIAIEKSKLQKFTSTLLDWWERRRFDYPWRKTSDPYRILISELMLRKTTRKQVKKVYEEFFLKYPTVEALSQAHIESIENTIKSLGMHHTRSKALKEIAEIIMDEYNGKIPKNHRLLKKLPSVGPYIANALLCLAYGRAVPLLDTNTARVLKRVFSLESSRKRVRDDPKMWETVSLLIPKGRARDFNLAILDFAASICLPTKPECAVCPLLGICDYGPLHLRHVRALWKKSNRV